MASVVNINPIKIKNDKAKICIEGFLFTKFPTGTAKAIITPTEITTAATIINNSDLYPHSSTFSGYRPLVIPTAVKILSTEKIISIINIWEITELNETDRFWVASLES